MTFGREPKSLATFLRESGFTDASERLLPTNGITLEVTRAGEQTNASGKLALCLHGFPEHAISWRHQVPLLVALGYRVWVPNLRGYGGSSRPGPVRAYRMGELVADVAGLIDQAQAQEVTLIGHDWGALIAWEIAIRRTRPLDRLVIMNVPHPAVFHRQIRRLPQFAKSWYIFFFQLPMVPELYLKRDACRPVGDLIRRSAIRREAFPQEILDIYRQNACQKGALTAMINYYRANFGRPYGEEISRRDPAIIEVPTLMVWGEEDIALDTRLTEGTDAYVRALTVKKLPGVSHWVQQDAPQTVNRILADWLSAGPGLGRPK